MRRSMNWYCWGPCDVDMVWMRMQVVVPGCLYNDDDGVKYGDGD